MNKGEGVGKKSIKPMSVRLAIFTLSLLISQLGCTEIQSLTQSDSTSSSASNVFRLVSPVDGANVKGTITLQAIVPPGTDVESVDFQWDGRSFSPGNPDRVAPYAYDWDTTQFVDGLYTLTAVLRDKQGQTTKSNLVTVRVTNTSSGSSPPPVANPPPPSGKVLRVPQDYPTPQAAINAAQNGDVVELAPGTYSGGLKISGKAITLASRYMTTKDPAMRDQTIISEGKPIITIEASAGGTSIVGFTLREGSKGVVAFGTAYVFDNIFDEVGSDAMSFEGTGGIVRGNTFIGPSDDGIDGDEPLAILIENNLIMNAEDDGIEIRNHNYDGELVNIVIRNNVIVGSEEDGIQIIDYNKNSNRVFTIERNVIRNSAFAGLGIMDDGDTTEDFRAASIPERIYVFNNTFDGNNHGISGGDNLIALNNIITNSAVGMKGVDGNSIAAYNLFFQNTVNYQSSNINVNTTKTVNPAYTAEFRLSPNSPAKDAGVANYVHNGETVLNLAPGQYSGTAPDLGAYEL